MVDFGCSSILFFQFGSEKLLARKFSEKSVFCDVLQEQKQKWQGRRAPSLPLWLII